jgi:hypothetical protein
MRRRSTTTDDRKTMGAAVALVSLMLLAALVAMVAVSAGLVAQLA